MTDPKPNDVRAILDCGSPIMDADTNRPHSANFLEVEGGMSRIGLEQRILLVRKPLNLRGEVVRGTAKTSGWRDASQIPAAALA